MSRFQSLLASSLRLSQLAMQNVARVQRSEITQRESRSLAGWMPEQNGRLSVGVGRRHPAAMRKASLRALSMRRVCALQHQAGAQ